ncbi:MAG TPA: TlpA disulfide reductase family protein [Puia sp.]
MIRFWLLILFSTGVITSHAQSPALYKMGEPAPPLRLRAWLKGGPVEKFEKGKVYVLEFWATWCKPCIAEMPHVSAIANKYKEKVVVLGIDISEKSTTPIAKLKTFVDSMGHRMDFLVAVEDSDYMRTAWLDSTGEGQGIPKTIVVDAQGRLAWIGSPGQVGEVLPEVLKDTWNAKEYRTARDERRRVRELSDSLGFELSACRDRPDSVLRLIAGFLKAEPQLKYMPSITTSTFNALLKTDPQKALEYGKELLSAPGITELNAYFVYGAIEDHADKMNFPTEIYRLAIEACQVGIDSMMYPDNVGYASLYHKMADFYWRLTDKASAISAEQKAIEFIKKQPGFFVTRRLPIYESRLHTYTTQL